MDDTDSVVSHDTQSHVDIECLRHCKSVCHICTLFLSDSTLLLTSWPSQGPLAQGDYFNTTMTYPYVLKVSLKPAYIDWWPQLVSTSDLSPLAQPPASRMQL